MARHVPPYFVITEARARVLSLTHTVVDEVAAVKPWRALLKDALAALSHSGVGNNPTNKRVLATHEVCGRAARPPAIPTLFSQ